MANQPAFASLPAFQADQIYPWHFQAMDYLGQAGHMNQLAGFSEQSKDVAG